MIFTVQKTGLHRLYIPCPETRCHSIFVSTSAKCWPIFKTLLPTDLAVNSGKAVNKYPTNASNASLHYLVKRLCSKIARSRAAEWSELPCKTPPFKTVAQKYAPNNVSIILFTDKKYLQWSLRKKTRRVTDCTHIRQPGRKTSWQNACAHN